MPYITWPKGILASVAAVIFAFVVQFLDSSARPSDPPIRPSRNATERAPACNRLTETLPHATHYSEDQVFVNSIRSYWSVQERELSPDCLVKPNSVDEVSTVVGILNEQFMSGDGHDFQFAIRSGGHAPSGGIANIDQGVTIDLGLLHGVTLSGDKKTVDIGPGARWIDVYESLEPLDISVSGGRVSDVGVGGLVLGGGLSFFSGRTGFVCDNIVNFEVVLANATVVQANESSNRDLWVALKGGSNNFGVVTRVTAKTFSQGKIWGGYLYQSIATIDQQLKSLFNFSKPEVFDDRASSIFSVGYNINYRSLGIGHNVQYAEPTENPPIFQPFTSIKSLWNGAKIRRTSESAKHIKSLAPAGYRQTFATTTFENDLEMLNTTYRLFEAAIPTVKAAKGVLWNIVFQPLPPAIKSKSKMNPFGLHADKSTSIIVLLTTSWKLPKHDRRMEEQTKQFIEDVETVAKERGLFQRYKYLNYAGVHQDPLASYGDENYRMLQDVSRKYDPAGLFQKACVGGFKLSLYDQEARRLQQDSVLQQ
ncbi:MAG: hypothetical protein M1831_000488 [Alyxoria varia]|nr:MAG: hypothetical protein M1831_000488 [Alyxoria varia]